jgi:hypothetical protein
MSHQRCFLNLFKSFIRSHVEYANFVGFSCRQADIAKLEKVQRHDTKLVTSIVSVISNKMIYSYQP